MCTGGHHGSSYPAQYLGSQGQSWPSNPYQYKSTNTSLESQTKVQRQLWFSFLISTMGLTISSLTTCEVQLRSSIFEGSSVTRGWSKGTLTGFSWEQPSQL